MLPKHQDCSGCCAVNACHFCLRPGDYTLDDGKHSYRCCGMHVLWLLQCEAAPGSRATREGARLPLRTRQTLNFDRDQIREVVNRLGPLAGIGVELLNRHGTQEVDMILQGPAA